MIRLGGYTVNLFDFYFYRLIGKLTFFLESQEFTWCRPTSNSVTRCYPHVSRVRSDTCCKILPVIMRLLHDHVCPTWTQGK